jgi:hypothetical protein
MSTIKHTGFAKGDKPAFTDGKKTQTQATEKRKDVAFGKGGGKDKIPQQASKQSTPGRSVTDGRGTGRNFAEGGSAPGSSIPLGAEPALPGRTGTPSARGTQRTDYSKG